MNRSGILAKSQDLPWPPRSTDLPPLRRERFTQPSAREDFDSSFRKKKKIRLKYKHPDPGTHLSNRYIPKACFPEEQQLPQPPALNPRWRASGVHDRPIGGDAHAKTSKFRDLRGTTGLVRSGRRTRHRATTRTAGVHTLPPDGKTKTPGVGLPAGGTKPVEARHAATQLKPAKRLCQLVALVARRPEMLAACLSMCNAPASYRTLFGGQRSLGRNTTLTHEHRGKIVSGQVRPRSPPIEYAIERSFDPQFSRKE